jgi:Arc/MetJ-type ribon-helix-helix transcriptional regulator
MAATRSLTVTLPADLVDLVERRVEDGAYVDASALVTELLEPLRGDDAWIAREARASLAEVAEDPRGTVPIDRVPALLLEHYARRHSR